MAKFVMLHIWGKTHKQECHLEEHLSFQFDNIQKKMSHQNPITIVRNVLWDIYLHDVNIEILRITVEFRYINQIF